ncbi:GntR family transcriptional regulator [Lachnospiraceae bacterium KGMB03038]|nr:GntR family transcriptional regulator [Lachnospiraceae bacterium KGMB03038]
MKKETLSEKAYRIIREKIVYGELEFGEEIDQKELTKELNFKSITPVREALLLLQKEKMITIIPRKGIYVSEISIEEVLENFQMREIIEPTVFEVTALRVPKESLNDYRELFIARKEEAKENVFDLKKYLETDMEFHLELLKPIGNRTLESVMRGIYEQNARYRMACLQMRNAEEMLNEHLDILQAIEEGDPEKSVEALKKHIYNSKMTLLPSAHQFL